MDIANGSAPASFDVDGTWPTLTRGAPVAATLGPDPEHFVVDEVDAYPAIGEGEHLFVRVRKRGLSTLEVARRLAQAAGVQQGEVGFAGRKDARGLCSQRFSLPARARDSITKCFDDSLQLVDMQLHVNKLKLGHLAANRFAMTLFLASGADTGEIQARATQVAQHGVPNYFGEQRFGEQFSSALDGMRILLKGRGLRDRRKSDFLISAAQSMLFNDSLGQRLRDGLFSCAVDGDVLKTARGGLFVCENAATDTPRVASGEVTPTGPMFGRKMMPCLGTNLTRESGIPLARGVTLDHFSSFRPPISGTRRPYRVMPGDLRLELDGTLARLAFSLDSGAYATVVLREIFRLPVS